MKQGSIFSGRRVALLGLTVSAVCGGVWMWRGHTAQAAGRPYSNQGFGGFVGATKPQAPSSDPVLPIEAAYNAGHFSEAERLASGVMAARAQTADPALKKEAARALWVSAYAAARRGDFKLARLRFTTLRDRAAELPDRGRLLPEPGKSEVTTAAGKETRFTPFTGEVLPSLEEEGAFQAAICRLALKDARGAEQELDKFLCNYPQSILIHAAVKRIGRMHGGDVPKEAEKLWQTAKAIQAKHDRMVQREAAMCGPECLAELLRRKSGKPADMHALANAMRTSADGTTLANLAEVGAKQGIALKGAELSQEGLAEQKLPVVALIQPGHFVLVESVTPAKIGLWDPDAEGPGHSGRREVAIAEWEKTWSGLALVQ